MDVCPPHQSLIRPLSTIVQESREIRALSEPLRAKAARLVSYSQAVRARLAIVNRKARAALNRAASAEASRGRVASGR